MEQDSPIVNKCKRTTRIRQREKEMIFATGDTHGDWMHRLNMASFPEQRDMGKDDYVIILGDFGLWDGSGRERHALDWLEARSFTTLFVDGNHENYDMLDALPAQEWHGGMVQAVRPSVLHLMRGQIFTIQDRSFFAFGGARSHDIRDGILDASAPDYRRRRRLLDARGALYRVDHISWWVREMPSETEMEEGLKNLAAFGNKVDYIVTHSPFTSLIAGLDGGEGILLPDPLTDYLEKVRETVSYRHWLFGHMHVNMPYPVYASSCLYEQIVRIA